MATPNQYTAPQNADYGGDEVSAIVLDPGYAITKAGFAGEDVPKSLTPTYYGVKSVSGGTKNLFGDNAMHDPQPDVEVRNPLTGGGAEDWVSDWDAAAELWEYTIASRLTGPRKKTIRSSQAGSEENGDVEMKEGENVENGNHEDVDDTENPLAFHPLLFSEPGRTTASSRQKIIELAMENWDIPAFYLAKSGVLAAFSVGKTTALVVDVGASMISVTPLMDGMILKKGVKTSPLGGNFISQQIRQMFATQPNPVPLVPYYQVASKRPVDAGQPADVTYRKFVKPPTDSYRHWEEERVIRGFKESVVQVYEHGKLGGLPQPGSGTTNEELASNEPGKPFEMPDGWNKLFGVERYKVAEGLFDASGAYVDSDHPAPKPEHTVAEIVEASLNAVDQDVRPALLNNIVIVGGASLTPGFVRRFDMEIKAKFPGPNVRLSAPSNPVERKYAPWIGGSILASLGSFHQLWISRKEYDEHGPSIVDKRSK